MAMMKKETKKLFKRFSVVYVSFLLIIGCFIVLIPEKSGAIWHEFSINYPVGGVIACPTNININTNQASANLQKDDGAYDTYEATPTEGYLFGTFGYFFNDDPFYKPGFVEDQWPIPDTDNITITEVRVTLVSRPTAAHDFEKGHFTFTTEYDYNESWTHANTWLPNASIGGWGIWINTSEIHDYDETGTFDWLVSRDVTAAYDEWTIDMLFGSNFRVYFWTNVTNDPQYWDYAGITFKYTYKLDYDISDDIDVDAELYGIVWMIIIFSPGMVLTQLIPKIGMLIGLGMTTLAIGIIYPSFLPVTAIALGGIVVYFYKGEE